jgi:hypothetical protein
MERMTPSSASSSLGALALEGEGLSVGIVADFVEDSVSNLDSSLEFSSCWWGDVLAASSVVFFVFYALSSTANVRHA